MNRSNIVRLQNLFLDNAFYLLLLCCVVLFGIISNSFLTVSNWTQISIVACFLLTASAGLTLVMITGSIDLSIGSVAYLAAAVVYLTSGYPPAVSLGLGVLTGALIGTFNGILVSYLRMNPLLTTLGLMIAYRGGSLILTGGTARRVNEGVAALGQVKFFGVFPFVSVVSLLVVFSLAVVLSQTKFGAYCYAIGNNESAARKIGIPVRMVRTIVFVIAGTCASISGLLLTMYLGEVTTVVGRGMEFQAVAAVVIGGTSLFGGRGSVMPGTLAGVLLLVIINNGLGTHGVSPYLYPFVAGVVIFLAIYLDSLKNIRRSTRLG